ncbi:MAG TPA: GDSL-type esterase/lipase family protein [Pyrinomonadaceae bacterium]|nr:GDSL-type esterase/lipase family protein [Pyrinomonadaceae bacterium]
MNKFEQDANFAVLLAGWLEEIHSILDKSNCYRAPNLRAHCREIRIVYPSVFINRSNMILIKKIPAFLLLSVLSLSLFPTAARAGVSRGSASRPSVNLPRPKTFVLDQIAAQSLGAYSMRRLRRVYLGPAIRVRRPGDNAETDLVAGFSKAAADAFGANLKIIKIYDQSGNGRDLAVVGTPPKLSYLTRPMIDFYECDDSTEFRSAATINLKTPTQFFAIDPIVGSSYLTHFGGGQFATRFSAGRYTQTNGADVSYGGRISERGTVQLTSEFKTGKEQIRVDGAAQPVFSGTNAGDAPLVNGIIRLGNYVGLGSGLFLGRVGEFLLFDGDVSNVDRDTIESSQMSYYLDGRRIVVHGDSLAYGSNLGLFTRETVNYGGQTRDLLGAGWDVYNRAVPGSSFNNISGGEFHLINSAAQRIDVLYRPSAAQNILVVSTGWNDVNGGETALTLKLQFVAYCLARKAAGWKVVVAPLPIANYPGQPVVYPAIRLDLNAWLAQHWHEFADAYADFSADPVIGNNANTANTVYWQDQLHMTRAGYTIWAKYLKDAVESISDDAAVQKTFPTDKKIAVSP